jgi:hypothetical protein
MKKMKKKSSRTLCKKIGRKLEEIGDVFENLLVGKGGRVKTLLGVH